MNVYNKRGAYPADAVYIGRPTKWGNPFVIGPDGTREEVVNKFREYVLARPDFIKEIRRELTGKDLVCFCAPLACHGDIYYEIIHFHNSRLC